MLLYAIKLILSLLTIVLVTETAKRSSLWGGILASLPLVSLISFIWLYLETKDNTKIIELSWNIFWLVLPSLVLFLILPILLKWKVGFFLSLILATVTMVMAYSATIAILKYFGIK